MHPLRSAAIFLPLLFAFVAVAASVGSINAENRQLESRVATLSNYIVQQYDLIAARADDVSKAQDVESTIVSRINEFTQEYQNLAVTYLKNKTEVAFASRSGDRTDKDFVAELQNMRSILSTLTSIKKNDLTLTANLTDTENKLRNYINSIPTGAPVSGKVVVTSGFGYRNDPITHLRRLHTGLDVTAPYGTKIYAAGAGTVVLADWDSDYGKCVKIDHGNGIMSVYAHCSTLLVKAGDSVKKGALIAKSGSTGRSTGPHLHYEIDLFGQKISPYKFLGV